MKILWDFYGTFALCISTPTALISHRFPMTCSMGNLWDISVLIMTMKNHSMFTHCILRIVLSALTKYVPCCKQIAYSIHYFDWLQLNSNVNTLTCCSNKQKLDENFIEFLLTCSCYVLINALSFIQFNNNADIAFCQIILAILLFITMHWRQLFTKVFPYEKLSLPEIIIFFE